MNKTIIDSSKSSVFLNLVELIEYRDLFLILAWRDLRVRYAQTFLGFLWALVQPLAILLIFTLIFGRAIKVETGDIPYPVFALCGMLAWSYFSYVLGESGQSVIGAQEMVKKIYFPRLVIPLSKALTGLIDFLITLLFLLTLMWYYGVAVHPNLAQIPLYFILNLFAALGVGIWVAALTVRFRDFQHIIPFLVQFGLYATPIAYPASLVPAKYQLVYHLNPMAGVVEGYRYCFFGSDLNEYSWISFLLIGLLFVSSLFYFRKVERVMADLI